MYGEFSIHSYEKKFSGKFTAKLAENLIVLFQDKKEVLSAKEITFIPNDLEIESFLLRDVVIGINFHWQKKERERFTGSLKLIKSKNKIIKE